MWPRKWGSPGPAPTAGSSATGLPAEQGLKTGACVRSPSPLSSRGGAGSPPGPPPGSSSPAPACRVYGTWTRSPVPGSVPATAPTGYERDAPGDMIHVDVKKLGRIPDGGGWRADPAQNAVNPGSSDRKMGFDYVHASQTNVGVGVGEGVQGLGPAVFSEHRLLNCRNYSEESLLVSSGLKMRVESGSPPGISVWWKDHADHHMSVLLDPRGPFYKCDMKSHRDPNIWSQSVPRQAGFRRCEIRSRENTRPEKGGLPTGGHLFSGWGCFSPTSQRRVSIRISADSERHAMSCNFVRPRLSQVSRAWFQGRDHLRGPEI
jgi:hypothetical protein